MSVRRAVIDATFGGNPDPLRKIVEYAGTPDNVVTITATSPYGKGTLCYDTTNEVTYYKTDTDATDWTLID